MRRPRVSPRRKTGDGNLGPYSPAAGVSLHSAPIEELAAARARAVTQEDSIERAMRRRIEAALLGVMLRSLIEGHETDERELSQRMQGWQLIRAPRQDVRAAALVRQLARTTLRGGCAAALLDRVLAWEAR